MSALGLEQVVDAIPYVLAAVALAIAARAIGRRPLAALARRLVGAAPLRPPGAEPGAERWFAAGGVAVLAGLGVAALVTRKAGYPIAAVGLLAVAYAGVLIALDRRGAARAFVRRAWTELDVAVPAPLLQMRIVGAGMALIAAAGALIVLAAAFR